MNKGICFIFSAPSGTGKSSIIQKLLQKYFLYNIELSVSYTTRKIRPGEIHGRHYYFISELKFKEMIKNKIFLEYAKVFDNYYGTSKTFIQKRISIGKDVFLDIDWQGAKQVRKHVNLSKSIFILPPSKDELFRRLKKRAQDSISTIYKRMHNIVSEIIHCFEYDHVIVNNNFEYTIIEIKKIIEYEKLITNL